MEYDIYCFIDVFEMPSKNDKCLINAKINRAYLFKSAIHKPLASQSLQKMKFSEEMVCFVLEKRHKTQVLKWSSPNLSQNKLTRFMICGEFFYVWPKRQIVRTVFHSHHNEMVLH